MTVTAEPATVYRGGGRRWLTFDAAVKAEAVKAIKRKHPTERENTTYPDCDLGFHWREIPRSDVMLRRMCRLVKAASNV